MYPARAAIDVAISGRKTRNPHAAASAIPAAMAASRSSNVQSSATRSRAASDHAAADYSRLAERRLGHEAIRPMPVADPLIPDLGFIRLKQCRHGRMVYN